MEILKRILWSFVSGFMLVLGGALALVIFAKSYNHWSSESFPTTLTQDVDPRLADAADLEVVRLELLQVTRSGGVKGQIKNKTSRRVNWFRAELRFVQGGMTLFACEERVEVDLAPGATGEFYMVCDRVDRQALPVDAQPKLKVLRLTASSR